MAARGQSSVGFNLANILRGRIASGKYKERFPTEHELTVEFDMSRYAVRSALQRLESDGQISRRPGRGTTVVSGPPGSAGWAIRTVEDLIDSNLQQRPTILSARPEPASRHPEIARLFGVPARGRIFVIERLSQAHRDGAPFFSLNFLPVEIGRALPGGGTGREPLAVQIERMRKVRAHRVRQDIRGGRADKAIAGHLGIAEGDPTVVVRRTYYGWDGEVIVLGELHYRLDGFRQAIELFRENKPAP